MTRANPTSSIERLARAVLGAERLELVGARAAFRGFLLARMLRASGRGGPRDAVSQRTLWVVTADEAAARLLAEDIRFFAGEPAQRGPYDVSGKVVVLPEPDASPYADVAPDPRVQGARQSVLYRLSGPPEGRPRVVLAGVRAFCRKVMPPSVFAELCTTLEVGTELDRAVLLDRLLRAGYRQTDTVVDAGTFAVRGGVLDVYVPSEPYPTRIDWFGDEVERMRSFDPESQRGQREQKTLVLHPCEEHKGADKAAVRARLYALADTLFVPTTKTREIVQNVEADVDFFGVQALIPAFFAEMSPVTAYLPEDGGVVVDEPMAVLEALRQHVEELSAQHERARSEGRLVCPPEAFVRGEAEVASVVEASAVVLSSLEVYDPESESDRGLVRFHVESNDVLRAELEAARARKGDDLLRPFVDRLAALRDVDPWTVSMVVPNRTHADRLVAILLGYGIEVERVAAWSALEARDAGQGGAADDGSPETRNRVAGEGAPNEGASAPRVVVVQGELDEGFSWPEGRQLVLCEADLFGLKGRTKGGRRGGPRKDAPADASAKRRRTGAGSLSALQIGDFIVHVVHGVGRYLGLAQLVVAGVPGDFMLIEYAGGDRFYLPVDRLDEIERYLSAEAKPPRLDKMGGTTFAIKSRKVKDDIREMAEELLQIYAERSVAEGHAFPPPDTLYASFEATFAFEETPDQEEAISAVHADLSRPQPMDRLVCGDVGFGKTEVALRAAFRVVEAKKQVAVLAPTTVLVQQHYRTFVERMSAFGVRVGRLSRFVSPKERAETLAQIRAGTLDVVVGTHRLLSQDVRFADLGLVVIDEEQRFGVAHKERFKKLRARLDVLTLSATPIPRTLELSLLGVRELSLILTPPVDRLAVKTLLTRDTDVVIAEAIAAELARGGQVFYVVPKVLGIAEHAERVRRLVPHARVSVAHGQMPGELLEKVMLGFVDHEADVLVSTTIIESGLDIPRANTMLVARADQFGMSQLHQLRGRIGRAKVRAHCYLMVNSLEKLAPEGKRRLEALARHSSLGAGFNIASHDLEIRGAGELLGPRQSGHIQNVGFDAYVRLLEEAVAELRGEPIDREDEPELALRVPAFLPDTYVEDVGLRLEFYRRFSAARQAEEVDELLAELWDRFGELPVEAVHLGLGAACKAHARKLRATSLEWRGEKLTVRLAGTTPVRAGHLTGLRVAAGSKLELPAPDRLVFSLAAKTAADGRSALTACCEALGAIAARVVA